MSDRKNVIEALSAVMGELPAIGKDSKADPKQGGYSYRGIEAITQHAQPLFAKHGVVFTPHVRDWQVKDITVNNKPWTDTFALIEYTVYGPGGVDDHITVGPILAIGRDNSDKGANKCMTQAFKYALLQAFTIADAKDDGDQASHDAQHAGPPTPVVTPPGTSVANAKQGVVKALDGKVADAKAHAKTVWERADLKPKKVTIGDQEIPWLGPEELDVLEAVTEEYVGEVAA